MHAVSDSLTPNETDELFIDAVNGHFSESEQAFANIKLGKQGTDLKFKLDTGAQVNVIPLSVFHQLETACKLQLTSCTLTGYGGQTLAVKGMCKMDCAYKDRSMMLDFYVVNTKTLPS